MRRRIPFFLAALCLVLTAGRPARAATLRGYHGTGGIYSEAGYDYVQFGSYPSGPEGETAPVLWRVLGAGTPQMDDVISCGTYPPRSWIKQPNGDELTGENADAFCLMSEYILDMIVYHPFRDDETAPLDYDQSAICSEMNGRMLETLFTPEERSVLIEMPGRGLLSLPSRKGELFRADYGFAEEDFVPCKTRRATGTPYAYSKKLKRISGHSWYFTTDWRRYGARWIVGDNGHISVSGVDRAGGVRPVCYLHTDRVTILGGTGSLEDPYVLRATEDAPDSPQ